MRNVVFVAPFLLPNTLRFVTAAGALPGVRLLLLTQDDPERLEPAAKARIDMALRIPDAVSGQGILDGIRRFGKVGPIHTVMGPLEQIQGPLAEARQALGLPGLSVEAATNFREKSRMKTIFQHHGIPCARHRLCTSEAEAWAFAEEVGYPMVVKPPAGAGAKATFRVDGPEALRDSLAWSRVSPGSPWLFEEFMTGREFSFDTVSIDGKPVWHSLTHYLPTPLEALENPWIQWCVLLPREVDHPRYDDIRREAFRAIEVLGMVTGQSHMEWFRRPDGSVAISEVAARPPGAQIMPLMSWSTDTNFYRAWARLMIFGDFVPPARRFAAGAAFLRGMGEGRIVAIHGLGEAQAGLKELGVDICEVHLPTIGQPRSSSYEGEGNIVIRHPDTEVVERGLHRIITSIRLEVG